MRKKAQRSFICDKCGYSFHITRKKTDGSGNWVRYMPPNFCPECGAKVVDA